MLSRLISVGLLLCSGAVRLNAQTAPESILCWATRSFGPSPRLLVDLRLRSGNGNRLPSAEDVRAVTTLGGVVTYRFDVAVLRASVDTSSLRQLLAVRTGVADVAYPVADSSRHDVWIQVFYSRAMTRVDDSALVALGGKGLSRLPKGRNVSLTLANSAIPAASQLPDVSFVRAKAMVCGVTTGRSPASVR